MPRNYSNKRRYNRRSKPIYRTKPFGYYDMYQKVAKDVSRLKSLINVEFKAIDTGTISAEVNTTAIIALLNSCIQGDDFDNREGRTIRVKSVQLSVTTHWNISVPDNVLRVLIVIDKQPNGILMLIGDLLDATNSTAFRNLDNRKRFVILLDRVVSGGSLNNKPAQIDYYKKMDMITTYNSGNAGTIADIETNALYLVLLADEATEGPVVDRDTRIRYIDN